jgi:hypothetical protein
MSSELTDYISTLSGAKPASSTAPEQTDRHTCGHMDDGPSVWEVSFRALIEATDPALEALLSVSGHSPLRPVSPVEPTPTPAQQSGSGSLAKQPLGRGNSCCSIWTSIWPIRSEGPSIRNKKKGGGGSGDDDCLLE